MRMSEERRVDLTDAVRCAVTYGYGVKVETENEQRFVEGVASGMGKSVCVKLFNEHKGEYCD